jgi:general secretion pathway protein L
MTPALKAFWTWLVDGLTEAVAAGLDRFAPNENFRLKMGLKMGEVAIFNDSGLVIGKIMGEGESLAHFEPPTLAMRLKGSSIDVEIPPVWVLLRSLNPIAVQSAPFVEAFARHHIERITPWRAADTYFHVRTAPVKDNANELSVNVDVVAKRMVEPVLRLLAQANPARIRLFAIREEPAETVFIPLDALLPAPAQKLRRNVERALIIIPLLFVAWFVFIPWRLSAVTAELEELDKKIADRKNILFAAAKGKANGDPAERLRFLRSSHPRVITTLETLSASLPDTAYLTDFSLEGDKLRITGVASQAAGLVPALELSGSFADATFTAATTREENGSRDRFHLEMRVIEPREPGAGELGPDESGQRELGQRERK